jgi:hypothetical protein
MSAIAGGFSAKRDPGVSYKAYYKSLQQTFESDSQPSSSYDVAVPLDQLDQSKIPKWETAALVENAFLRVRDSRFMFTPARPEFARRSSWLYPDDGCYARAALAKKNMIEW